MRWGGRVSANDVFFSGVVNLGRSAGQSKYSYIVPILIDFDSLTNLDPFGTLQCIVMNL